MISESFLSRFLKYSFHFTSLSSRLAAFSFALDELFLPFTSFTVCHAIRDRLSSTEFLILSIWPCMYSNCFLSYVGKLFLGFPKFLRVDICWVSFGILHLVLAVKKIFRVYLLKSIEFVSYSVTREMTYHRVRSERECVFKALCLPFVQLEIKRVSCVPGTGRKKHGRLWRCNLWNSLVSSLARRDL